MAYEINYDDDRFKQVESDKQAALTEAEKTYGDMISESDKYYQAQIDASKEWANKQQELQQANTDLTLEKIGQQREQAHKDYLKEQSGAYKDWQKESNRYGANAEQMAASGLGNTGYSESSQVSMYNTYQNRVATARESFNKAILNYDNAIKDAQLANNSALAQIAYEALQQQLELSLQGFQYKNQLILERANKKQELDNTYYGRYQDVLNQMNTENSLQEQIRQYNESMKYQKEQDERNYQLQLKQLEEDRRQFNASLSAKSSSGTGGSGTISGAGQIGGKSYAVNTDYYQGALNPDANTYGTFANGYQPKGIDGHGLVEKTGDTIDVTTESLSGQKRVITQNLWKTPDGKLWCWNGKQNKYVQVAPKNSATKGAVGKATRMVM